MKLIVEMEINGSPDCCGLCDPLFRVVCATKHDQTIDKMMLRAGRPAWCPIVGVLPEEHGDLIDRDEIFHAAQPEGCTDEQWAKTTLGRVVLEAKAVIAAERSKT